MGGMGRMGGMGMMGGGAGLPNGTAFDILTVNVGVQANPNPSSGNCLLSRCATMRATFLNLTPPAALL